MGSRQRSWGAIAFAVVTVGVGGFAASAGGSTALAGTTTVSPTSTTTTTTTTSTTTTSTTSTSTLPPRPPLAGQVDTNAVRQDSATWVTAMPTFPPPPTTTTTTIPNPCANTGVPANSGSGRRVVYSKSCQRVWLVEEDGTLSKTHAVSGRRTWNQPTPNNLANDFEPEFRHYGSTSGAPGYYRVSSRSAYTCNINKPYLCWRYMVRFTKGSEGDNIGFHEIPVDTRNGRPVQNESQLGTALSNGCVRQATPDARYMWDWAWNYTKVVVLA